MRNRDGLVNDWSDLLVCGCGVMVWFLLEVDMNNQIKRKVDNSGMPYIEIGSPPKIVHKSFNEKFNKCADELVKMLFQQRSLANEQIL